MAVKIKKVFFVYTNSGAGHRRAAEAMYDVARDAFPDAQIEIADVLDYSTPLFKRTYPETYLTMVNRVPRLWGWSYAFLDFSIIDRIGRIFRRRTNALNCRRFCEWIAREQPDLVITTHFLPNEIISQMKKKNFFHGKLVTCITDYYPHAFWRDNGVDLYITPNEDLIARLNQLGVPVPRIRPLGIPIGKEFLQEYSHEEIREKLGLNKEKFTILLASGGFGIGPVEDVLQEILKISAPLQIMVVCGNNLKLQENLKRIQNNGVHDLYIFGFVQNMHELMAAGDVMVTKSGGLTTTEAMARGIPMIVLYPIPGQEESNCNFIVRHHAGKRADNPEEVRAIIERLLKNPEELMQMHEQMKPLGRPSAATDILKCIKERFDFE